MGSSVSLFHFDGYATNRQHKDRFQFFIVEKGESVSPVGEKELKKLLDANSDDIALMSLARLLESRWSEKATIYSLRALAR